MTNQKQMYWQHEIQQKTLVFLSFVEVRTPLTARELGALILGFDRNFHASLVPMFDTDQHRTGVIQFAVTRSLCGGSRRIAQEDEVHMVTLDLVVDSRYEQMRHYVKGYLDACAARRSKRGGLISGT